MRVKYFCSWWGLDHLGIEKMLQQIKAARFDGVEIGIPNGQEQREQLRKLLDRFELDVIAHQYQAQGDFDDYRNSFRDSLLNAASFRPLFINSHSGRDFWTFNQNQEVCDIASEVETKTGIKILHETHRKHFLFSTLAAKQFFRERPELKITADFSHWTCVSETMLEDQEETIRMAIERAEHIHARVGFEEGPQVPDPRAPEWDGHLKAFVSWWQQIVDRFNSEGRDQLTITPEFGPAPYTWALPFSRKPVSDFFELNCWTKKYLQDQLTLTCPPSKLHPPVQL